MLCLFAFVLRLPVAFENRFHADEALYATWAMQIASGRDVLLRDAPIDKPPLAIYAMAASFALFGRSEFAARLPNLIASVVSVALIWLWARSLRLSSSPLAPNVAAIMMALSPLNIALAGTAFLDPLMVMSGLAACVASPRGRAGLAGIFLGLSFATKVQGLLFAPLVLLPYILDHGTRTNTDKDHKSAFIHVYLRPNFLRSLTTFMSITLMILLWDRARASVPFWVQQTSNYGGIRFAFDSELAPRLAGWLGWLPYLFGPLLGVLLLAGLPILLFNAFTRNARTRAATIDLYLIAYTIGFLAFHWLLAFPLWDRYLLILVPAGSLLFSRLSSAITSTGSQKRSDDFNRSVQQATEVATTATTDVSQKRSDDFNRSVQQATEVATTVTMATTATTDVLRGALMMIVVALTLPFAIQSARSELPIGGDHGAHDGIDQVADYLRTLPNGTVIYDHWLGWELDFYLWDAAFYRAYFDTPAALADDLRTFGATPPRYLVTPASESLSKIERAIAMEGFMLTPVLSIPDRFGQTSYIVYQVSREP